MRIICIAIVLTFAGKVTGQDTTKLSLLFLGDIMQHGTQINATYNAITKKYDYTPCFKYVKPFIASADVAIGNLEVTLAGAPYSGYPQFSAPDELLVALKDAGMDALVTANNHCVDKGRKGLERTIHMLDSFNIPHTGTFTDETNRLNDYPLIIEKRGFKIALLNYTFSTNGLPVTKPNIVNRIDTAVIHQDLIKVRALKPDVIVVFTHWGIEYQSLPSAAQKSVTEFCFKKGADLVIGAHPHVIQPMEWRKDKNQIIAYSLGNFVSGQRKQYTDGGAMIKIELKKIAYKPDSAITKIDTAGYLLQWVYRTGDANKDYYILPVPAFENDTTGFIKDTASKLAFKTFIKDSRSLYGKHNINVTEINSIPDQYVVTLMDIVLDNAVKQSLEKLGSITMQPTERKVIIGTYYNYADAVEVLERIHREYQISNAAITKQ